MDARNFSMFIWFNFAVFVVTGFPLRFLLERFRRFIQQEGIATLPEWAFDFVWILSSRLAARKSQ